MLYDAKFDVSAKGLLPEALFVKWGSAGYLEFDKTDIKKVEVQGNFWSKKAVLILADGSKHIFNYGFFSIYKVVDAIKSNINNG